MSTILGRVMSWGAGFVLERPVKNKSLDEMLVLLQTGGVQVEKRLANAAVLPENDKLLRHMIGIERWGQRRLRVGLGEEFLMDECDSYYPASGMDWSTLVAEFRTARSETLQIGKLVKAAHPDGQLNILHNRFGGLSVKGWLRYLDMHSKGESRKLKKV